MDKDKILFDPDKFNITKAQMIMIFGAIEKRWTKSKFQKLKNAKYVIALEATKLAISWTDEEVLRQIWKDIIFGFNTLIRLNDEARMRGEYPDMKDLLDITLKKLESGELFEN